MRIEFDKTEDNLLIRHQRKMVDRLDFDELIDKISSSLYLTKTDEDQKLKEKVQDGTLVSKLQEAYKTSEANAVQDIFELSNATNHLSNGLKYSKDRVNLGIIEGTIVDQKFYLCEEYVGKSGKEIKELIKEDVKKYQAEYNQRNKLLTYSAGIFNAPGVIAGTIGGYLLTLPFQSGHGTSGGLGIFSVGGLVLGAATTLGVATAIGTVSLPLGIGYGVAASGLAVAKFKSMKEPKRLQSYKYMDEICNDEIKLKNQVERILNTDYSRQQYLNF